LDFLAVTDHAEEIGVFNQLENPVSAVSRTALGKKVRALLSTAVTGNFREIPWPIPSDRVKSQWERAATLESASAWQRNIEIANRYW